MPGLVSDRDDFPTSGVRALGAGCLLAALAIGAHADPQVLTAQSDQPRAFGYSVGDVVTRHIRLQVPEGLKLVEDSLPRVGGQGRAMELRRVTLQRTFRGTPETLELEYQVFLAPRELRVLEMPPIELRFVGVPRAQTLRIDAWPVSVTPLAAVDASPREGLGEMRPDREPMPIATEPLRWRLIAWAAIAVLLLAYLAHVYIGLPWWNRRHRPFGLAWQALRGLPVQPDAAQRRRAFEQLHAALNASAGEALFEPGLDGYVAARPRFAPLRAELGEFFARSRAEFFAAGSAAIDGRWLREFCRRCRDAERGAA
jgi:mxaA protein